MDTGTAKRKVLRKPIYPLRMETIPLQADSQDLLKSQQTRLNPSLSPDNHPVVESQIGEGDEEAYTMNTKAQSEAQTQTQTRKRTATLENDDDFKFKRHQNNNFPGIPTLGEKLDNLHNYNSPKRMENFDSSFPINPSTNAASRDSNEDNNNIVKDNEKTHVYENIESRVIPSDNNRNPSQKTSPIPSNLDSQPPVGYNSMIQNNPLSSQPIVSGQYPPSSQFYQMYYVPVPGSPSNHQMFSSQPSNIIPNSSLQPFYPYPMTNSQPPHTQQLIPPFPQLLPNNNNSISNMNNGYYYPNHGYHNQSNKRKRRSTSEFRGRRLSIVSNRENSIILPHSDVPPQEFYRHLADVSNTNKLKQLFTWCSVKSYNDLIDNERNNTNNNNRNTFSNPTSSSYVDSKKITLDIVRDFINDLQNGNIDINWNQPKLEINREPNNGRNNDDKDEDENVDPEIKELFDDINDDVDNNNNNGKADNDETYYYDGLKMKKFVTKKKKLQESKGSSDSKGDKLKKNLGHQSLLPNPKNAENEMNLKILNEKIDKLNKEIEEWKTVIDNQQPDLEWKNLKQVSEDHRLTEDFKSTELQDLASVDKYVSELNDLKKDLSDRIERLQAHSHLYNSHAQILTSSTSKKGELLSKEFKRRQHSNEKKINSLDLLRGLSDSLNNKISK